MFIYDVTKSINNFQWVILNTLRENKKSPKEGNTPTVKTQPQEQWRFSSIWGQATLQLCSGLWAAYRSTFRDHKASSGYRVSLSNANFIGWRSGLVMAAFHGGYILGPFCEVALMNFIEYSIAQLTPWMTNHWCGGKYCSTEQPLPLRHCPPPMSGGTPASWC